MISYNFLMFPQLDNLDLIPVPKPFQHRCKPRTCRESFQHSKGRTSCEVSRENSSVRWATGDSPTSHVWSYLIPGYPWLPLISATKSLNPSWLLVSDSFSLVYCHLSWHLLQSLCLLQAYWHVRISEMLVCPRMVHARFQRIIFPPSQHLSSWPKNKQIMHH